MQAYGWPGNVRELENAVTRAVVCAAAEAIEPGDLPPEVAGQIVPSALTWKRTTTRSTPICAIV